MTEKRYYEKDYDELYYIFDSKTLSEKEFEKKVEYDGYDFFAYSLTSKEVVDLLNELHEENEKLKRENEVQKDTIEALTETISHFDIEGMTEKREITIVLEDDFGRATTKVTTKLSPPQLMDKILEVLEDD